MLRALGFSVQLKPNQLQQLFVPHLNPQPWDAIYAPLAAVKTMGTPGTAKGFKSPSKRTTNLAIVRLGKRLHRLSRNVSECS